MLEETRRVAARLDEGTEFYARFIAQANAVYLEVRAAVAVADAQEESEEDGCA